MDRENRFERTPDRSEKREGLQRTGQKMNQKDDPLIESKYEFNENSKQQQERNNRLDQIEAQIKSCVKRLQQIQLEEAKETDKYSERYLELQHERTQIKKRVIDLGYHHKVQLAGSIRESRRREAEEKDRLIKQAQQESQRRKKELDDRLAQLKQKREERSAKKQQNQEQGNERGNEQQDRKEKDEKLQKENDQLARSRRKLRMAQIEAELAQSRLRRSRVASLNAELDYLRATYSYPYWTWRDYYPYSYYPYVSPSIPSLYPYSSYYPYSPYSYISPLRYRWWL